MCKLLTKSLGLSRLIEDNNSFELTRNYSSFVNNDQNNNNKLFKDIGDLISANSANIIQSTKELNR